MTEGRPVADRQRPATHGGVAGLVRMVPAHGLVAPPPHDRLAGTALRPLLTCLRPDGPKRAQCCQPCREASPITGAQPLKGRAAQPADQPRADHDDARKAVLCCPLHAIAAGRGAAAAQRFLYTRDPGRYQSCGYSAIWRGQPPHPPGYISKDEAGKTAQSDGRGLQRPPLRCGPAGRRRPACTVVNRQRRGHGAGRDPIAGSSDRRG